MKWENNRLNENVIKIQIQNQCNGNDNKQQQQQPYGEQNSSDNCFEMKLNEWIFEINIDVCAPAREKE